MSARACSTREGSSRGRGAPPALAALPAFRGDAIDETASHGDLGVQVCARTPDAAGAVLRRLVSAVRPLVRLRWRQTGFRDAPGPAPRGVLGFHDGTANLDASDDVAAREHLWVSDGPDWLHGGTYLVARRIRLLVETWDRLPVPTQEGVIGRTPAGARTRSGGGHAGLAAPAANGGVRLLRRSYSYQAGVDANGLEDTGLVFVAYTSDPARFTRVQRRLAALDALNAFSQHRASAVFACPPAPRAGACLAEELVA